MWEKMQLLPYNPINGQLESCYYDDVFPPSSVIILTGKPGNESASYLTRLASRNAGIAANSIASCHNLGISAITDGNHFAVAKLVAILVQERMAIAIQKMEYKLGELLRLQMIETLTVLQTAAIAGVEPLTVRRWLEAGHLKGRKTSTAKQGQWRIARKDLDRFLSMRVNYTEKMQ